MRPLRVYALIELGIGIFGLVVLRLIPLAGSAYTAWSGYGVRGFLLRGLVAIACLLPPTLLMGATLPALARQAQAAENRITWLGFFYGANIAGAVLGCLVAGFYLLRLYDVTVATYAAAGINVAMGSIALAFAGRNPGSGRIAGIAAVACAGFHDRVPRHCAVGPLRFGG